MKKTTFGALCIVSAALMWGIFPMFNRYLYANGVTVMQAVAVRTFISSLVYLFAGLASKTYRGLKARDVLFLFGTI